MSSAQAALRGLISRAAEWCPSEVAQRLVDYLALLEKWNSRVDLVASTRWEVLGPLFEEGIWARSFYPEGERLHLDIGSGAGFPALLLRILNLSMELHMVESRGKRAAFLETAAQHLGLVKTFVFNQRLGEYLRSAGDRGQWSCVSWKGLRLGKKEVEALLDRSGAGTQFWMFHGLGLPVEDAKALSGRVQLRRREAFPAKRSWFLSIYEKV